MHPEKLANDPSHNYFSEEEYFKGGVLDHIHTYLHKDYRYKMHAHQFYEINIIISGKGRHYIGNTYLDTSVGDIFVIPPEISHGYDATESLNIYHILIKQDFFRRYALELSLMEGFHMLFDYEPHIRRMSGTKWNLHVSPKTLWALEQGLEQMTDAEKNGQHAYTNVLALKFIFELCQRLYREASADEEKELLGVMEYIKENLSRKLSLPELASFAGMSCATLQRRFKALTGQAPMSYVLSCRIEKAKRLIEEHQISRTAIALECGFYDTAHMNKYLYKK